MSIQCYLDQRHESRWCPEFDEGEGEGEVGMERRTEVIVDKAYSAVAG